MAANYWLGSHASVDLTLYALIYPINLNAFKLTFIAITISSHDMT